MKERYLEELKKLLGEYSISQEELDDIIADYGEMIDDAISKNMSDEKIVELIGTPEKVVEDLSEGFEKQDDDDDDAYTFEYQNHSSHKHIKLGKRKDNRIVALMPFISTIVFFILGFGFDLWHPGWMVFLLIPVVAIIINVFEKGKNQGVVALSPFIAIFTFFILGFVFDLWHPGWLVFLIIPVIGVLSGKKNMSLLNILTALSPFVALSVFILYGTFIGDWSFIWLVFLIIPILGGLNYKKVWQVLVFELSMAIAVGAYLYLGFVHDEWFFSLFAFLIPLGVSIIISEGEWSFTGGKGEGLPEWLLLLACLIVYFGAGFIFGTTWSYLWMIFLSIPVLAIMRHASNESKLVAIMPFIATILFFSLGFFWGFWEFSWIAFLLIPVVAIIKNA
jgi:uncharacterized membrane protein